MTRSLTPLLLSFALVACGQTGPLYRTAPAPETPPAKQGQAPEVVEPDDGQASDSGPGRSPDPGR